MDWGSLGEKVIPAAITGLGGFVGAALNFKSRIDSLEKDVLKHIAAVKEEFDNVKKAWRLELEDLKSDLQDKIKELSSELKELDDGFTRFQRASNADFANAEDMRHFIEDQQRQWQQIQRTLGQIEGLMERVSQTGHPTLLQPKR